MSKNRFTKTTIYILTEGETEYAYFSRIGEIIGNETDWKYSVKVEVREIVKGSKTDPINIVKEAKKSKNDFDEIWVVFDKDRERDEENRQAIELAAKSKINVAFSSISFEHWLILHFEKNDYAFERSDCESRSTKTNPIICNCNGVICAKKYLTQPNFYPTFVKGKSLLYDDLKSRIIFAIENAAWLRKRQSPYAQIHKLNPYTDADILVAELLSLNKVEYLSMGNAFDFEGIRITLLSSVRHGNNISLSLNLNNQRKTSFPLNDNQQFTIIDENGNPYKYNSIQSSLLHPTQNQNVTLVFTANTNSQSFRFKTITTGKYFLVDIL